MDPKKQKSGSLVSRNAYVTSCLALIAMFPTRDVISAVSSEPTHSPLPF